MAVVSLTYFATKAMNFVENEVLKVRDGWQEVDAVKEDFDRIKAILRDADSLEEGSQFMKESVRKLRNLADDIEDALDEYKLLKVQHQGHGLLEFLQKSHSYVKNWKACRRIMLWMRDLSSKVKSICEEHQKVCYQFKQDAEQGLSCTSTSSTWHHLRGDALLLEKDDLVGIDEPQEQLVKRLVKGPPEKEIIPVVGMGGSGKTTLIKQVFDDPAVKKHFTICAWITLSPSSRTAEVLRDMLQRIASSIMESVPSGTDTLSTELLKMMVKSMLQRRRSRYLIILDDVWRIEEWDAVKHAFPNNKNGSRIMMTTRDVKIASSSCKEFAGEVYYMKPLRAEQSWKLFCMKTFKSDSCPSNLKEICEHILRKCEGLPLAIVAISGILATKDSDKIDEWQLVHRSIRSEIDGNGRLKNLKKVLSLSFNALPYHLKPCFLHLSVFPRDQQIEHMRLIRLWVADGLVKTKEGKTPEEVAEEYLKDLLNRSLIQAAELTSDGRVKMYRVHDLLWEISRTNSEDRNFAAVVDEQHAVWTDRVRRLSVHKVLQSAQPNEPLWKLRSLFMSGVRKSSINRVLSSGLKLLRVLDFQDAPLKRFPTQVIDLHLLRYLNLRCTKLQTLPSSIGMLQHLETLDLKHTFITVLLVEITKLHQLRHLLVYRYENIAYSHSKYGFKPLGEIGALQCLQKLCYIEVDDQKSRILMREIGKLIQLRRLGILKLKKEDGRTLCLSIAKLTNLRSISISSLENGEIDLQNLFSPPQLLQRVFLTGKLQTLPHWIAKLHNLAKLKLKWSHLEEDPMSILQSLPSLIHLELLQAYDWQRLCFEAKGFKKLKVLGLDCFEGLTFIQVEEGAMPCLEKWSIQRCKCLKNVPSGIEHLSKLKVLELFDMPDELIEKLKPQEQDEEWGKVAHIPELSYGYWRNGGWDVKSVETAAKKRSNLPPCWK
ncbi:disease resistance protein RPM1-like [Rhodamnia argentea]|uniref:Disease resistance protein RPM1-like n=1 Tax=Rhodamnia argentea TaxID=178133 RepID=A0A8B8PM62_9MYRT|nr:disease resistance protein RPM1-like [Rhodamnia argentea]